MIRLLLSYTSLMTTPITHFKRIERKYLLTLAQKNLLLEEFSDELLPDTYGTGNGVYKVENIYYDTLDLQFYNEKNTKTHGHKKLRIRRYFEEDGAFQKDSKVFIEIKEKIDHVTVKRRIAMNYQDAIRLVEQGILPEMSTDTEVISEIHGLARYYNLKPQALTSYERQAFFGKTDPKLRLTFDTDVTFKRKDITLGEKKKKDGNIVDTRTTILEVKANGSIPESLQTFFEKNNIAPVRISKYDTAIEKSENTISSLGKMYAQPRSQYNYSLSLA